MKIKIHEITPFSEVNGPGVRTVIHFQGCKFQCPGCFNPTTHSLDGGMSMSLSEIICSIPDSVSDITISGGEPFLQPKALLELTTRLKGLGYTIVVFSGFYMNEIRNLKYGNDILANIDVLIDGRFDSTAASFQGLHGSDNQTLHFISNKYSHTDFVSRDVEILISADGSTQITGFPTASLLANFNNN
ncbi:4Fe-4S single cluster domain-containing protein [Paenibacillus glucanolyticus]|uniref:4Fe-4S single cluster domain-containing protein n=1 Tax=Paenibacillus glucanolyticus TaxID=59843 RepID=UPI00097B546C|nr:4Fe-4S single cluster domain-containing protein [Paenibacillus glucanolyticus]OMF66832.1 hypothetical protein BK142_28995 [Paenibacillus glucanolyticus]